MSLGSRRSLAIAVMSVAMLAVPAGSSLAGSPSKTVLVSCASGGSVGAALAAGGPVAIPLTIVVQGTCTEHVVIARDDVTLRGDTGGGGITGASTTVTTISIEGARRVLIDGLTVAGGRNGIVGTDGAAFAVVNSTVHASARNGISVLGGRAQLDGNSIHHHPFSGVLVDGGTATITNNTIESNGQVVDAATLVIGGGITVVNAGSARIGLTDEGDEAGNQVQSNLSDGIVISTGSGATLRGNQVVMNKRYGVIVTRAHGALQGNNLIEGNGATGLFVFEGVVLQQPRSGLLPAVRDVISHNGDGTTPITAGFTRDGIVAADNSVIDLRGALVTGNAPNGVNVFSNSTACLRTNDAGAVTTISSNGTNAAVGLGSGIAVSQNSVAILQTTTGGPAAALPDKVYVTGNGRYGVCGATTVVFGGYLSIQDASSITGNVLGQVNSTGC